jgi:hypothetical protein
LQHKQLHKNEANARSNVFHTVKPAGAHQVRAEKVFYSLKKAMF